MSAIDKTKNLQRKNIHVDKIEPNPHNPNEMSDAAFNQLYTNMEEVGFTNALVVVVHPDKQKAKDGFYMLVGGEHRWRAARLHGFEEVPCVVLDSKDFDMDMQKAQIVRDNVIKGKMSPTKFMQLYESLSGEYTDDIAAEMFGFAEEEEFKKLINAAAKQLPKDAQKQFKEAAKDLRTLDELSKLLNYMLDTYGDSLPFNYMVMDFGGKDAVWLRMKKKDYKNFLEVANICRNQQITVDSLMSQLMQLIAQSPDFVDDVAASCEKVELDNDVLPIEENVNAG